MSGFLLDTHTLLWWYTDSKMLSGSAFDALSHQDGPRYVSSVSGYEIALKHRQGKLPDADALVKRFSQVLEENQFRVLPIELRHAVAAGELDLRHKDPFDRLLIAQSALDGLVVISRDEAFDLYGVRRLW